MPAALRHRLRAESAQDVLASSFSTFSTLEQRMGIAKEQKKEGVEVSRGHF